MTTLFSREFDLLDTIRLWDSYLAETSREDFITYMCCAMVLDQREQLLKGDFGEDLSLVSLIDLTTDISLTLLIASEISTNRCFLFVTES